MRKSITLACLAALLALLLPAAGLAQPAFNIKIFPSKLELSGEPGTVQNFVINVENLAASDQMMRVYFNDYLIKADNEFVFKEPGHYSYSCAKWLSTEGSEQLAPAGQTVQKVFTLKVPEDAEPGGHYAVIFFEQAEAPGKQVTAKGRIGVITLVTVPGEIIREGNIKSVSVTSSWFWPTHELPLLPKKKLHARVVFYNSGNVHLTVKGKLTYVPTFGWGTGTMEFGEITVLPKTTRYLEADIKDPPFLGSYKVKAEAYYGPALDMYDTTRTGTTSFSVYPLSLLLILLVLLTLVIVFVALARRRRRKRRAGKPEAEGKPAEEESGEAIEESAGDETYREEDKAPGERPESPLEEEPEKAPKEKAGDEAGRDERPVPAEGGVVEPTRRLWRRFRKKRWEGEETPREMCETEPEEEPETVEAEGEKEEEWSVWRRPGDKKEETAEETPGEKSADETDMEGEQAPKEAGDRTDKGERDADEGRGSGKPASRIWRRVRTAVRGDKR